VADLSHLIEELLVQIEKDVCALEDVDIVHSLRAPLIRRGSSMDQCRFYRIFPLCASAHDLVFALPAE
jgi:hypothetical protein